MNDFLINLTTHPYFQNLCVVITVPALVFAFDRHKLALARIGIPPLPLCSDPVRISHDINDLVMTFALPAAQSPSIPLPSPQEQRQSSCGLISLYSSSSSSPIVTVTLSGP